MTFHLFKPPKSLSKKEIEIFRIDCHVYYDIPGLITLTKDFDNYNILNRWFPKLPLSKFAHPYLFVTQHSKYPGRHDAFFVNGECCVTSPRTEKYA